VVFPPSAPEPQQPQRHHRPPGRVQCTGGCLASHVARQMRHGKTGGGRCSRRRCPTRSEGQAEQNTQSPRKIAQQANSGNPCAQAKSRNPCAAQAKSRNPCAAPRSPRGGARVTHSPSYKTLSKGCSTQARVPNNSHPLHRRRATISKKRNEVVATANRVLNPKSEPHSKKKGFGFRV
jgi:hypothetical protein